ncbi:MAG: DUF2865 domain-containing protein [Beijerinckiaceae bacterium]
MRRLPLVLVALVAGAACAASAYAQSAACIEYRAERATLERSAAQPDPAAQARLQHAWQQMGCGRSLSVFGASAECEGIAQRLGQMRDGPALSRGSAARHAELSRLIDTYCQPQALVRQRNARGSSVTIDSNTALSADSLNAPVTAGPIDGEVFVEDMKPPAPPPPVNATCVRLCDGFPFPLSRSPGGAEGADEMCQALCPGAQAKAYFRNGPNLSNAVGSDGKRYAALETAGLHKKQFDPRCTCKAQGQTWNSALRRARELSGAESDDTIVSDAPMRASDLSKLRGTAAAESRPRKRGPAAIDPEDDPLPLDQPKGIVHLTPIAPPIAKPAEAPQGATDAPGNRTVRVVGPTIDTGSVPGLGVQRTDKDRRP